MWKVRREGRVQQKKRPRSSVEIFDVPNHNMREVALNFNAYLQFQCFP